MLQNPQTARYGVKLPVTELKSLKINPQLSSECCPHRRPIGLKKLMYQHVHCACRTGRPNAAEPRDGREGRSPILALSRSRLRLLQQAASKHADK